MTKNTTTEDWPEKIARRIVNHGHECMLQSLRDREAELRKMSSAELKAELKRLKVEARKLNLIS